MKKIIIALDGDHFPQGAFEFAKSINLKNEILLAGVFLSPVDYSKLMAYTAGVDGVAVMPEWLMKNDDDEIINKNIELFEEACVADGLHYRVHKENNLMALASLVEESRFADLLLISSELFYKNIGAAQPNYYLEENLKRSECPVMLIPENYKQPSQILLSYDGGESAMFAIKQFAYLFPELVNMETTLLSVTEDKPEELPEYAMVTELLTGHYPNLKLQNVKISGKKLFIEWLALQPNSFIVMGAFSRSMFSELFKKSFARNVIQDIKMPLFVSHK
ncbi:hypothetical protein [Ferruginibacter sp.]|nr:hypothetical protein [Ferruginibacter sp.]